MASSNVHFFVTKKGTVTSNKQFMCKTHNEQWKRPNPHRPFSRIVLCGQTMGILYVYNATFLNHLMVYHGTTVMTARSVGMKTKIGIYVFDMLFWLKNVVSTCEVGRMQLCFAGNSRFLCGLDFLIKPRILSGILLLSFLNSKLTTGTNFKYLHLIRFRTETLVYLVFSLFETNLNQSKSFVYLG